MDIESGSVPMAMMTFPAETPFLTPCLAFVTAYATAAGIPPRRVMEIELAVEEAFANICQYAYPQQGGEVEVHCTHSLPQGLLIELRDTGQPFNPLTAAPADHTVDFMQRREGGWGITLVRSMIDHVAYRREGSQNILQLTVQMTP